MLNSAALAILRLHAAELNEAIHVSSHKCVLLSLYVKRHPHLEQSILFESTLYTQENMTNNFILARYLYVKGLKMFPRS